jgi:hypothetical protein
MCVDRLCRELGSTVMYRPVNQPMGPEQHRRTMVVIANTDSHAGGHAMAAAAKTKDAVHGHGGLGQCALAGGCCGGGGGQCQFSILVLLPST